MIRRAEPSDRAEIEAIVAAAYSVYIDRIGKPPGPMLDDYAALIAAGAVSVWAEPGGALAALIVLLANPITCCSTTSRYARIARAAASGAS